MSVKDYTSSNVINKEIPSFNIEEYDDKELIGSDDYVKDIFQQPVKRTKNYLHALFPFTEWLPHYFNHPDWIFSDFITGLTVAIVLVPQSMSYAKLAQLHPQFGLYSAFIGTFFYFLFATSREICIGPVAVLSTEVGKIISRVQDKYGDEYTANEIATTLALISGGIVLGIGLLRLGFIVELISLPAILAFTTGSAFHIAVGQLAGLMGVKNSRGATYKALISFLKHLPDTKVDAAFGLTGLFVLYFWQFLCEYLIKNNSNNPRKRLLYTYISNLRTAFVIIISTCISFGVLRYRSSSESTPYGIIGDIPSGLNHVGRFIPPPKLASRLASDLPISTIVLVLEHISISKSFARMNGYRVNPNQEFMAIGFTNMVGTFFGAYPVTGSFSRTALSAKCGVKTPLKSAFTGACVLLAIYCFTNGFYYIPKATLSAIIIHCVTGLMASYKLTTKMYMFSPVDFVIFIVGVFVSVFSSIENGIYWAMCASCAEVLWRMLKPNGVFMGRIKLLTVRNPHLSKTHKLVNSKSFKIEEINKSDNAETSSITKNYDNETTASVNSFQKYDYVWVPEPSNPANPSFVHTRYINENITIESPPPGVLVYRLSENFIYTNSSLQIDKIIYEVRDNMRPFYSNREKLWCEYTFGEKNWKDDIIALRNFKFNDLKKVFQLSNYDNGNAYGEEYKLKPKLRILHLDFSQVVAIDSTSIQSLHDLQRAIDNHCGKDWELHFSGIINPWVIRGLVNAGFGKKENQNSDELADEYLKIQINSLPFLNRKGVDYHDNGFDEQVGGQSGIDFNGDLEVGIAEDGKLYPIYSTAYPNFHINIPSYTEYDLELTDMDDPKFDS